MQSLYFNSQNFCLLVPALFYMLFAVLEESIQAGALLRPKNGYVVWSHGESSVRARRVQAQNIAAAYFVSCRVQSAERVARRQLA